jgi:hypothetical protein
MLGEEQKQRTSQASDYLRNILEPVSDDAGFFEKCTFDIR